MEYIFCKAQPIEGLKVHDPNLTNDVTSLYFWASAAKHNLALYYYSINHVSFNRREQLNQTSETAYLN